MPEERLTRALGQPASRRIQKATDDGIAKIDAELKLKEAEVMAV